MNNKKLGVWGEVQAQKYLKKAGYKILETNYETKLGEMDIVAKIDDTLVFVEVKTRETSEYGMPFEAVTAFKQNKYIIMAKQYLLIKNPKYQEIRFDVISILGEDLQHIENAFDCN
ncbi:MAG: YraN family protein [Clostridia bacterium]